MQEIAPRELRLPDFDHGFAAVAGPGVLTDLVSVGHDHLRSALGALVGLFRLNDVLGLDLVGDVLEHANEVDGGAPNQISHGDCDENACGCHNNRLPMPFFERSPFGTLMLRGPRRQTWTLGHRW